MLRTACDTVFYEDGEAFHARNISPPKGHDVMLIDQVVPIAIGITNERFKYVNFVCWHDAKRHEKPIYLVSNLFCAGEIIEYYDLRYAIECLFKDMKSTAFNLHQTRLKKPEEVSNLVMIAALAFILLTVLAIQYDSITWRKKVQRYRKDRKVLSFFTFALRLFEYFIDYVIDFDFSFQFSKNLTKKFSLNC
ncbi:MAG: transposase [Saprospiraceae bacterium]|nr:transposase [Saprospiraceae bacterium]